MGMRAGVRGLLLGFPPGASGASAPTVEITSASAATVYEAFSATITFSEAVTGFTVDDITAGNATLSEFADSGDATTFTVTVTPTAAGAVTLDIAAGVCTDAALNENEAAAQFSRTAIVYLLRDEFTTARAAGAVTGTAAEPGPGTRTLVDTGGICTITSAGRFNKNGMTAATFQDPRLYYENVPLTRAAGLICQIRFVPGASGMQSIMGLRSALDGGSGNIPVSLFALATAFQAWDASGGVEVAPMVASTPYVASFVLDDAGARWFLQGGELYKDHTLIWSTDYGTASPLYASPANYYSTPVSEVDYVRVWQGTATLLDVVTFEQEAATGGATVGAVADGMVTLTVTAPGTLSGSAGVKFRMQDANNYWHAYFDDAGAFKVDKYVDGSADVGSPYVNVASAITASGTRSICVLLNANKIRCFTRSLNAWTKRGNDITSTDYAAATDTQAVAAAGWALGAFSARPAIDSAYNALGDLRTLLVFDGDSLTLGSQATAGNTYPEQTLALLGGESQYKFHNFGFSGAKTYQVAEDVATQTDPLYWSRYPSNIFALWVGTNNLKLDEDVTTVYNEYVALCQGRQAVGYQAIAFTVLPRNDSVPAGFEDKRQAFNALVRANWATFADALADVAADTRIGDAGDEEDETYYADGVHPNDAGYAIVAGIVKDAIDTLLDP